ncbi:hypothetical protein [Streptomyces collinus]|uniref:hypothetical protein n=1 Tax=Streptomyces collinus TaxID=42684 RepID=UPI0036E88CA9
MSRDAEVIVLARWSDDVMEPLTRDDPERMWRGRFVPIAGHWGYEFGWAAETDQDTALPDQTPEALRDTRPPW